MEMIAAAAGALVAEPMALVMAFVAVVCALVALTSGKRVRDRVFMAVLALISGTTTWMIASRWRW